MRKYDLLLFDIDGTLLDFKKAERIGMKKTLLNFGLRNDNEILDSYSKINESYWEMLEKGTITKKKLLLERHNSLFNKYGFNENVIRFNAYYEDCLANESYLLDNVLNVLSHIKKSSYTLVIATNGLTTTQTNRILLSGLDKYFHYIFISEKVGYNKPQVEYFEFIMSNVDKKYSKSKTLIIGDSLTSDIKGGNNFGIDTCWINPNNYKSEVKITPTYEIKDISQLKDIIV